MKINENYIALENAIARRYEEIAALIEVFEGRLSLSEILMMDIPFLNRLKDSRRDLLIEVKESREKKGSVRVDRG